MLPNARTDALIVQEVADETLVYDLQRHEAHCLNRTAALVWRHCNGQNSLEEVTRLLQREMNAPADQELVLLALQRLEKAHLLAEQAPAAAQLVSRRDLARKLSLAGALAVAIPVVTTIMAPPASASLSGGCFNAAGDTCIVGQNPPCCAPMVCQGVPGNSGTCSFP